MVLKWLTQNETSYAARQRTDIDLVLYGRQFGCLDQIRAAGWLDEHGVAYRFVDIGANEQAAFRLEQWVGYQSVPTFVIANPGTVVPVEPPDELNGRRPRGLDRGTMITEPSIDQLAAFLLQHDLVEEKAV